MVVVAALRSLTRSPLRALEAKSGVRCFGAMETSSYGNIVSLLLLLIVLEAPAVHLLVGAAMDDGPLRGVIRGLLLGSSVYAAVWLLGDLRLLRETPGVSVGNGVLAIELGQRVNGHVPLSKVSGAQLLAEEDGARAIRVTPLPRPNCRVRLRSEVTLRSILGIPLRGDLLDIYVDDPTGLVSAIEAQLTLDTSRPRATEITGSREDEKVLRESD